MFIEILNYGDTGCKAKCPTCPQTVSGPNNGPHKDLMFIALNGLKNKFKEESISFSFQNDIADLPKVLEQLSFEIGGADQSIGCNIKMPFDKKVTSDVFAYLGSKSPNVKLALFVDNRGFLATYKEDVLRIIEIFFNSKIKRLGIACHNNSMRINVFDRSIEEMFEGNMKMFKEILLAFPTNSFQKMFGENLIPLPPENYKQFMGRLSLQLESKELTVTERVLSFEEHASETDDLISSYKNHFATELTGQTFSKEDILLAFTAIGVRVNHRSMDIRNPYLWLSYDEFFELLNKVRTLEDLCSELVVTMKKTGFLSCKINKIDYETIQILAEARNKLVL